MLSALPPYSAFITCGSGQEPEGIASKGRVAMWSWQGISARMKEEDGNAEMLVD